ncbi:MAG: hypothetical protein Q9M91_05170 [Candidatus Dojkabacteria bacterium]|nr:hypothetical protein [Candidatus Dojkabacteria bacterium]MDQ7021196.1 hypothetical protein [Candidatus Dojkabacteria bacterium]
MFSTVYDEIYNEIKSVDEEVAVMYGYLRDRCKDLAHKKWTQPFVKLILKLMRKRISKTINGFYKNEKYPFITLYHKVITKEAVKTVHENGGLIGGVTINIMEDDFESKVSKEITRFIEEGVDFIKTDFLK